MLVESWVAGRWRTPADEGAPLLDATTGAEVLRLPLEHLGGTPAYPYWASFRPDGARIVTACVNGPAQVWDATTGAEVEPSSEQKEPP